MKNKDSRPRILTYEEAKAYLRPLGLRSKQDYIEWYRKNKPDFLPEDPESYYGNMDVNLN